MELIPPPVVPCDELKGLYGGQCDRRVKKTATTDTKLQDAIDYTSTDP